MKRWTIVYVLPLEVWMDIFSFPWISREEFGEVVDRIGNFKFAEHAQFYLHEWGKHTLGDLTFYESGVYRPRFCELQNTEEFFKQIYTAVRQQFLAASTPNTFALNLKHFYKKLEFAEFQLENRLGEELHGKWIERKSEDKGTFQITRHGADWSTKELQEWSKEVADVEKLCRIDFDLPTVGSLESAHMDVQPVDEEQHIQQQPCSSNDT